MFPAGTFLCQRNLIKYKIELTNEDYERSCQEYCSTNDTGPLFDPWAVTEWSKTSGRKKNGGVTGEEGDFWRRGLGSKTKDCIHHTLQICAINFPEKQQFFV
jgi:hypothetical protein